MIDASTPASDAPSATTTERIRSFHHADFTVDTLVRAKGPTTIAVCLPARNEAATVGTIVGVIRRELMERHRLVDDLVVLDDHSTDDTAAVAAAAGARVVSASGILPELANGNGKGRALWRSLYATDADIVVWCDADVTNFGPHFVTGLVGPLLSDPSLSYVKAFYRRPLGSEESGGGRVTELMARPLLALLFPELSALVQPLSGEYAGRRTLLEQIPFVCGYGVEIGLLIDVAHGFGIDLIAQVDLGVRFHRNRPLSDLGPQAATILQVALRRIDPCLAPALVTMLRPELDAVEVSAAELPALVTVPDYRDRPDRLDCRNRPDYRDRASAG